jgi:hypothetical protein
VSDVISQSSFLDFNIQHNVEPIRNSKQIAPKVIEVLNLHKWLNINLEGESYVKRKPKATTTNHKHEQNK